MPDSTTIRSTLVEYAGERMGLGRRIKALRGEFPPFDEMVGVALIQSNSAKATQDPDTLKLAYEAWERVPLHPEFEQCDQEMQAGCFSAAGQLRLLHAAVTPNTTKEEIDSALALLVEGTSRTVKGSPDAPARMHYVGEAFALRYGLTDDPDDLDRSIECLELALDPGLPGPEDRTLTEEMLAAALQQRFEARGRNEDRDRAIGLLGGKAG
ncbi:MAG TPA: hypothetical protein VLK89_02700 [Solirubrobacterales bacterium]|nr:hypothetical protein [Solirubrobacterales bacterium]